MRRLHPSVNPSYSSAASMCIRDTFSADFCLEPGIELMPLADAVIAWAMLNGSCLVCSFVHLIAVGSSDLMSSCIAISCLGFDPVLLQLIDLGLYKVH